ncbi:deaminase [Candidatus Woesearchaeota archaeon]|nr:deaminase [Candidatus Woesearchaeota archaeon]
MLSSLDGKISTGATDKRDFDKDLPKINGLKEGLSQYYDLEQNTDLHSFNSGRVMVKVGWNKSKKKIEKIPVSFILVDNSHLTILGVSNLLKRTKTLFIVTTNKNHPAYKINSDNLEIIFYKTKIDFANLFKVLKSKYKIKNITLQSGATLNSILLREKLIDRVSLVMCPALVGGEKTPSLIGGEPLQSEKSLQKIGVLKLVKVNVLKDSYLHLVYDVVNKV